MAFPRTRASADLALRWLIWILAIVAVIVFVQTTDGETGRVWLQAALLVFVAAVILFPPIDSLISRAVRRLAPLVVRNVFAWRLAALLLYAIAPFRWAFASVLAAFSKAGRLMGETLARVPAVRFLDRHRRTVCIVLVAAISIRSLAVFSLLQQGAGVTLWHWVAFSPTYIAFGITAPFVAALLLWRRGEWVLITAGVWSLLGFIGVTLAAVIGLFFASQYFASEQPGLLIHPLYPEPLRVAEFFWLWLADLLAQIAIIYYLGGRTADYYHGRKRASS